MHIASATAVSSQAGSIQFAPTGSISLTSGASSNLESGTVGMRTRRDTSQSGSISLTKGDSLTRAGAITIGTGNADGNGGDVLVHSEKSVSIIAGVGLSGGQVSAASGSSQNWRSGQVSLESASGSASGIATLITGLGLSSGSLTMKSRSVLETSGHLVGTAGSNSGTQAANVFSSRSTMHHLFFEKLSFSYRQNRH